MVFILLSWAKCFFNLLIDPLSYNFGGHFKSTYPPISLEYWPQEVMRPSLLAFKPSLTYTLIGLWRKLTLKILLITFFKLLCLKNCVMLGAFGKHYPLYQVVLWYSFFFLFLAWATCREGHHYWIIFRHEARWPLMKFLNYFGPLWGLWMRLLVPLTTIWPN